MLWTPDHPADVSPLHRLADAGNHSCPALLVGCITSNVDCHVGRRDPERLTHTPLGLLRETHRRALISVYALLQHGGSPARISSHPGQRGQSDASSEYCCRS
jgi:hypothetical protein